MGSVQVENNASDVNDVVVSTNNELLIVANNLCVERDSARDRQGENNTSDKQANGFSQLSRVKACCLLLLTIIFSVLDIGTDIWLMSQYFISGQNLYGALTLVFVWGPAFFNTLGLYGLCVEYEINTWLYQLVKMKWLLIILIIVPIASPMFALKNLILLLKNNTNKKDNREKARYLLVLQLFDSYLEALPQLTLQLSIILNNTENETQDTSYLNMLRWCSMTLSLVTVARVTYSAATFQLGYTGIKDAIMVVIYTLFLVVSRVLVLSMVFTVSPIAAGVYLILYWPLSSVINYCVEEEEAEEKTDIIESIFVGLTMVPFFIFFDTVYLSKPVDLKPCVYMSVYALYTLECVVSTVLWCVLYSSATHGTVWYYTVPGLAVLLYVLYISSLLIQRYIVNKREADKQRQLEMLENTNQLK